MNLTEKATRRLRFRRDEETNYAEARKQSEEVFRQVTRFAGAVAVIAAVVFLASFWGIAESVQSFFEGLRLHTIDADAERYLTMWDILTAIGLVLAGHIIAGNIGALYEVLVFSRTEKTDKGTRFAIVTITRYLVFIAAYSSAILTLHISFSSLGYVFAALSVGLGFGLQEIVSNFVSGLILFFERPVRVGDFVSVGDTLGTVEKISIRATEVQNLDRQVMIIPNRMFITQEVVNWSHNDQFIRRTIEVGVAYGSDVEQVKRILYDIASQNNRVRHSPPVEILMMEFGDSSLNFLVRVYSTIADRNTVMHEICSEITRRFEEEGIEIPFPQRDLHVRSIQDETAIEALVRHERRREGSESVS
jgi:potassium efflux system protein